MPFLDDGDTVPDIEPLVGLVAARGGSWRGARPGAERRPARGRGGVGSMSSPSTARDRPPEEAGEDTSFARGLRILLTVADRGEVRAEELSVLLDTPTSTVYRYLRTLTAFGFVDRHDGRYLLGPRLVIGSGTNVTSEQLIRVADPVLRYLVARDRRDRGRHPPDRAVGRLPPPGREQPAAPRLARARVDVAAPRRAPPAGCCSPMRCPRSSRR